MDEILTPTQVAERLQVKPSWVYEQTRERAEVRNPDPLPHIKMGRYLRFDWNDVIDWLERRKGDAGLAECSLSILDTYFCSLNKK